jgi:acetyltransferase EpsM
MTKAIMLGGGGFAREVLETIYTINKQTNEEIRPIGFVYDGGSKDTDRLIHGLPVLGEIAYLQDIDLKEIRIVASVGRNSWRAKMVEEAKKYGANFLSIIHPTVTLSKWAKIGEGAIIQRYSGIMPEVIIGDFFVANGFVSIGHDSIIGNYVHINTNAFISGGTVIGNNVFIGVKATVLTCSVGNDSVIGACALVTKDVPPNSMAKGIPARYTEIDEKEY